MGHWSSKYISTKFGTMACSEFVEMILREQFNCDYKFPQASGSLFSQSRQIQENIHNYAVPTETPREGDIVLMNAHRRICHGGLLVIIRGIKYVLHADRTMGVSALHRIDGLVQNGYTLQGYYTWQK